MAVFVSMPKLGVNMTKGTIVQWLQKEGAPVEAGQPLLAVETDKVVQEIEAPATGILAKIVKSEGEELPCLTVMAIITAPGEPLPEEIPDVIADGVRPEIEVEVVVPKGEAEAKSKKPKGRERIKISPIARKLARELGVDISKIVPSGKRITKEDIEAAYRAPQAAVGEPVAEGVAKVTPLTGIRRTIAERMNLSARTVARVGLTLEADATELIAWRERLKRDGNDVGYNELLAKIVAHALGEFPYMNAQLVDDEIREMAEVNVGIATDTERGLLVPVIRNANNKEVLEIHREFQDQVERARGGKSTLDDLSGGTFTITNLGMYEVEEFLPVINVPQCAILGIGAIVKKPVVVDEEIAIRPRMAITLSFDHRVVDGSPAARFLQRVKHLIENPLDILSQGATHWTQKCVAPQKGNRHEDPTEQD